MAEAGAFTAAAERLHISQPGISSSIRNLEHSLGATLFTRAGKRVELTEAGRELYSGARRALATLTAVESRIKGGQGVTKSTLMIGSIYSFAGLELAALIGRFIAGNPDVEVAVTVDVPPRLFTELIEERIELAFVTMPYVAPQHVQLTPIVTNSMVLACPLGHRLARQTAVELADIADENFVDFDSGITTRQIVDKAFAAAALSRVIRVRCNEVGSLLELAAQGVGVAIISRELAIATRVPVALIPIDSPMLAVTVAAATRSAGVSTEAGKAMWNLLPPVTHGGL